MLFSITCASISFAQVEDELAKLYDEMEGMDSLKKEELKKRAALIFKGRSAEKVYQLLGHEIPDFKLTTLNRDTIQKRELLGKRVLLNFWFTNCQPCIDEMPILNEIKHELKDKDIVFLAVTFENPKEVSSFLNRHKFDFTHLVDGRDFIDELGVIFYPKTIIIDEKGIVKRIDKKIKMDSKEDIEKWKETIIQELISE